MSALEYVQDVKSYTSKNRLSHDIPVECLTSNRECITIVWLNSMGTATDVSDLVFTHLRALNDYILVYTKRCLYLEYLASTKKDNDYVIAVLDDVEVLDKTKSCEQVYAILLVGIELDQTKRGSIEEDKKNYVRLCTDRDSALKQLQQVIIDVEHQVAQNVENVFNTFNRHERALQDVRQELTLFVWRQAFKVMIQHMPQTSEARYEIIEYCRSYYDGNQSQLAKIDEFERSYCTQNVIKWYTKSCFLFRLLNKALRAQDIDSLYTFRYFINDLSTIFERTCDLRSITRVYRGGVLSRDELRNYTIGNPVATNTFLSTSCDRNVAERFIGLDPITGKSPNRNPEDEEQFVLFTIDIDWDCSPDLHVADISDQSVFPDEREILFDIGTIFDIRTIEYDHERYFWRIHMKPSTEVVQHKHDYENYIRQRLQETNATILFGILLTDMGKYEQSAKYFQDILERMPEEHADRANVYFSAARVYRFMNQNEKALEFFQRAERLQRTKLPDSEFDLARSLAGIASVYYELQDFENELLYYQQSLDIYQRIVPEMHLDIARAFHRLGFAYTHQQQYNLALDYLSKSLEIYERTVPEFHPGKALALHNTGLVHQTLGKFDIALELFKKALEIRSISLPPNHLFIAQSFNQLSILYHDIGQYDLALSNASQALLIYKTKPVYNHKLISEIQELIHRIENQTIQQE